MHFSNLFNYLESKELLENMEIIIQVKIVIFQKFMEVRL